MGGFSEQIQRELGVEIKGPPPAIQSERDNKRVEILQNELKNESNPDNIRSIQTEIDNATKGRSKITQRQSIGAQVNDVLMGGKPATTASPQAATAPANPIRYTNDPFAPEPAKSADREVVRGIASGIGHSITGGLSGLWALAKTGGDVDAAANAVRAEQEKTYQPKGETAGKAMEVIGSDYNPLNWIPHGAKALAEKGAEAGVLSPLQATALETAGAFVAPGAVLKGAAKMRGAEFFKRVDKPTEQPAAFGSAGSAAATDKAAAANASPALQQVVAKAEGVHPEALKRHIEAESLPVPIKLTEGEATGNPARISWEQNNRGKYPEIGERIAERPQQFHQNMDAIRDEVAPNVYGTDHVQNGRSIIDAYKEHDAALTSSISAKYQALKDANGGHFPIDGVAFVDAAEAALKKDLKTAYVPKEIAAEMQRFKNGEPMSFEQFEALRSNLAADMRKADRAGDGNTEHAASIVRQALEDLPLTNEAAAIKPIADAARSAAKARFDLIKKDPAYKAVVNDKVAPDDFIQRFVINGKVDNVKTMIENLQPGSVAHETMAAGVLNHLKSNAGANFNQSTFNKGLKAISPDGKLTAIVGAKAAQQLETLGKVAEYTQNLPRGHFVNTSNTLTGALAEHGKGALEGAVNMKTGGFGGTLVRKALAGHIEKKEVARALQTGAGINLKDVGK